MLGPNITGKTVHIHCQSLSGATTGYNGALRTIAEGAGLNPSANSIGSSIELNASKSNGIYGSSSTVQPSSLSLNVLIKY